jgi:hypothetical protein
VYFLCVDIPWSELSVLDYSLTALESQNLTIPTSKICTENSEITAADALAWESLCPFSYLELTNVDEIGWITYSTESGSAEISTYANKVSYVTKGNFAF